MISFEILERIDAFVSEFGFHPAVIHLDMNRYCQLRQELISISRVELMDTNPGSPKECLFDGCRVIRCDTEGISLTG